MPENSQKNHEHGDFQAVSRQDDQAGHAASQESNAVVKAKRGRPPGTGKKQKEAAQAAEAAAAAEAAKNAVPEVKTSLPDLAPKVPELASQKKPPVKLERIPLKQPPVEIVVATLPLVTTPKHGPKNQSKLSPGMKKQYKKLLELRDALMDAMDGVAQDNLRSRAEGSEASAFGMHQADAGSDAYDRDFALSLLSKEQDALYEIEQAINRIEEGTYGICEMSGVPIAEDRLDALPFARYTVECQAIIEKETHHSRFRRPVRSVFGLDRDEEDGDAEDSPEDQETLDNHHD